MRAHDAREGDIGAGIKNRDIGQRQTIVCDSHY
jgi:hypothetical protein